MNEYEAILWNLSHYEVDPDTGCWNWTRARDRHGYGIFGLCGRSWRAHRAAYMVHVDDLNPDLVIAHACDNPSCINPAHLSQVTQHENLLDARRKGRLGCDGKVKNGLVAA